MSSYRAVFREEITGILESHAFTNVHWLFPGESGYHQPRDLYKDLTSGEVPGIRRVAELALG
jgi:hypothetical protein